MKFCLFLALAVGSATAWRADPPYYGQQYAGLGGVRGLFVDPSGDLLALSRSAAGVHVIFEESNGDGTIDVTRVQLINGQGLNLNHGVTFHNGFIYASSATTVYRWAYTPGSRTPITASPQTVISGIPGGGHDTRTLIFDTQNRLYVSVGSQGNVDQTSTRSRIRRFNISGNFPIEFNSGEVFADGLRNEVGLNWNLNGVLYGVENGADQLNRPDIGGDIHNGNPAEEMNRFDGPVGQHYGYPYCFSTHNLSGHPAGTQFAWPSFMGDGVHDDNYCRNRDLNQPPAIPMPAHMAPLGIDFYRGQNCDQGNGAFPCSMRGDAFVAFHGSWNSDIPVGQRVARFPFNGEEPTMEDVNVLYEPIPGSCGGGCIRPVNAVFNNNGHLLVSADANGYIVKVTYGMEAQPIRNYREY